MCITECCQQLAITSSVIVLSIFDIHLHHKLDVIILQQKYNFIAISNPASSSNPNCSELSYLGQRSLITTLNLTCIIKEHFWSKDKCHL